MTWLLRIAYLYAVCVCEYDAVSYFPGAGPRYLHTAFPWWCYSLGAGFCLIELMRLRRPTSRHWIHVRGRKVRVSRDVQRGWERAAGRLLGGSVTSTVYVYRTSSEVITQAADDELPKSAV